MKLVSLYFILLFPVLSGVVSCTLNEADQPVKIFGRITGSDGNGIGGVDVLVKRGDVEQSVITSDNGRYELVLPDAGQIEMIFSKTGYTSHEKSLVLLGGEKKRMDLILHTLSEDAYFNIAPAEMTFYNTGGSAIAYINTNVSFEQESVPSWLTVNVEGTTLTIQCDSNETHDERLGYIVYNAAYNLRDTMIVRQLAGPVLKVLHHWGNDVASFSSEKPFVTFSKEIEVISVKSADKALDYELSTDRKTVYINNLGLSLIGFTDVQLSVKSVGDRTLDVTIPIKMYINMRAVSQQESKLPVFTSDNKFVWIYSSEYMDNNVVVKQFSVEKYEEQKQLSFSKMSGMYYNPFNNSLYVTVPVSVDNRDVTEVHLYDAKTGIFREKFTVDYKGARIVDMDFARNGYGVMVVGENLLYIDSAHDHVYDAFPGAFSLYDPYDSENLIPSMVQMSNNYQTFILYGKNSGTTYYSYTIDAGTKTIKTIHISKYNSFVSSNSSPYVFYFSSNLFYMICQHVLTNETKTLSLDKNGIESMAFLPSGDGLPQVFTSLLSIISAADNSIYKFDYPYNGYNIQSSHDGKLLLVSYNKMEYLFASDALTFFLKNLK
jgi:hypothetical protein